MPKPFYQDDWVTLYHGDWRELIDPDLTADLILTDPPYGETSLEWDRWPEGWPALAARHARSMWCFGSMRMFLDRRDDFTDWRYSQEIVWEKHNGSSLANDRFSRVHEFATFWYRGAWGPRDSHHRRRHAANRPPQAQARPLAGGARPEFLHLGGRRAAFARSMHGSAINETEKPLGILEHLIAYGCPAGGLVLDLFAGSASTLMAAKLTGRRATGFEKREIQCELAARRLAQDVLDFGEAS